MPNYFMNTYHRLPVVFTHGEGCYLFDEKNKKYLDFSAGIAVNCLGHKHPALVKALCDQSEKLFHVSNYYQSDVSQAFAEKLVKTCGMKNVFLCNSGAEANEGACKIARKYSLKKYGKGRHTIVTLKGSFHGRTITTLSATGQERFHKDFGPWTDGFRFITPGNIDELDAALDKTVCGILIEAVQGESGVVPQTKEFVKAAENFCAGRDILLMFDEVQCGMGRTGTFFAFEQYGVKADVVTIAKGIAGGVPAGAVLAGEKAAGVLEVSDHGSTFGGNPLAAACGIVVLDTAADKKFLASISEKGERLMNGLKALNNKNIVSVRGMGLMCACDIKVDAWGVIEKCLESGLLILSAGTKTLRFLPPYIITNDQIDDGLKIINYVL